MPFSPHYRLTCSGVFGSTTAPAERFSFGLALAEFEGQGESGSGTVGGVVTLNDDQRNDLVADCVAMFGRPNSGLGDHVTLTEVKLATIGADGRYTADPFIAEVSQAGGQTGSVIQAPQVAHAVSLQTNRRGPTGMGRFFLPGPVFSLDKTTQLLPDSSRDFIAVSMQQFLNDLNNEPNIDVLGLQVVVASSKGYNSAVTGVRVGRAFDTMRTRRRSLSEGYSEPLDLIALATD